MIEHNLYDENTRKAREALLVEQPTSTYQLLVSADWFGSAWISSVLIFFGWECLLVRCCCFSFWGGGSGNFWYTKCICPIPIPFSPSSLLVQPSQGHWEGAALRLNPLGLAPCQQLDKCSSVWTRVALLLLLLCLLLLWSAVDVTVTAFTWHWRKLNYCLSLTMTGPLKCI